MHRMLQRQVGWLMAVALLAGGCTAGVVRRPEPVTQQFAFSSFDFSPPALNHPAYPTPRVGTAYASQAQGITIIASAVPGAGEVQAVQLGNVALLGIQGADPEVHRQVAGQVHSSFPDIMEIRMSSDPQVIARLRELNQMIIHQQSIGAFLPELGQMSAAMVRPRHGAH